MSERQRSIALNRCHVLHVYPCDFFPQLTYSYLRAETVSSMSPECLHHLCKGPNIFVGHRPEKIAYSVQLYANLNYTNVKIP